MGRAGRAVWRFFVSLSFSSFPSFPTLISSCVCIAVLPAAAQTRVALADTDGIVVVTGSREPQLLKRSTADLVLIDSERIRDSAADSVEELLRREAGLQISRNGATGQSAGLLIRGASSASTVVLVDGVRIGSATLGQADFAGLSLAQIDHIEVLRGPASSLYGADAVGGVVQIFTRRGEGRPRFGGHAAVGGYGSSEGDLWASGSAGAFDYAVSGSGERSDGVSALRPNDAFGNYNPDRDGYDRANGQIRVGWSPAVGQRIGASLLQTRLRSRYDASEYLPPSYGQDNTPDFRSSLLTRVASLDYRGTLAPGWTGSAQWARNIDDLSSGGTQISRYRTQRDQGSAQLAWAAGSGQQLVGRIEQTDERASADVFATDPQRRNTGVTLGYAGSFGGQDWQADLRRDDNSVYGGQTTGRIGWGLALDAAWRLRALAGTTFRAPSFNDLYYPGYGVATVQPERGHSLEFGLNWKGGASTASATVYRNRVSDLIGYQSDRSFCPADPAFDYGCAGNIGRARLQGASFGYDTRSGALTLRAVLDLLDATDEVSGERLARRARHQETVNADYAAGAWDYAATLTGIGNRPDGGKMLGGYATLDLQARWRFMASAASGWRLEARLLNAFDRDIEPARDYQGLGRQAWLGLRYDGVGL